LGKTPKIDVVVRAKAWESCLELTTDLGLVKVMPLELTLVSLRPPGLRRTFIRIITSCYLCWRIYGVFDVIDEFDLKTLNVGMIL
jgi:hypothetical protein